MAGQNEHPLIVLARRLGENALLRTEQSSERSWFNAERNLAALVHAAVVFMILGLALNRYQLQPQVNAVSSHFLPGTLTELKAAVLIGLGALMALVGGLRYLAYILDYRRRHRLLLRYGPLLAPVIALLVGAYGVALLGSLLTSG
ncbi:MAG TPA: DUF202 domain-containing protein [Gammaproteobacteria bacterium]|nr:DUF202 domain-containing protein [Gammaproteobacteria bacterium]